MEDRLSCTGAHNLDVCRLHRCLVMTTEIDVKDALPLGFRGEAYRLNLSIGSVGCFANDRIPIVGKAVSPG